MLEPNALGALAALGSAASWAIGAFLFKALGNVLSPLAMTLAKGVCSLVLLGIAVLALDAPLMDSESLAYLVASGLIGIAWGDTLFFRALQGLSAQTVLVLMVVGQVLTVVLAVVCLNEALSMGAMLGIGFVLAGVVVVLRNTVQDDAHATKTPGVVYGLLAVCCMALAAVIAKKGLGPQSDTIQATFVRMLSGTVGVFGYGIATRQVGGWITPFRDRRLVGRFVLAVAAVTFGGFWLGMVAFKYTTLAIASTLTATEPAFGLLIAVAVMREKIPAQAMFGTALTFLGVVLLSVPAVTLGLREWTENLTR